jgi:hypothetical protein
VAESWFTHVIAVPDVTVSAGGSNAKFFIVTVFTPVEGGWAGAAGDGACDEEHPAEITRSVSRAMQARLLTRLLLADIGTSYHLFHRVDDLHRAEVRGIPGAGLEVIRGRALGTIPVDPELFDDLAQAVILVHLEEARTCFPAGAAAGTVVPVDMDLHRGFPPVFLQLCTILPVI